MPPKPFKSEEPLEEAKPPQPSTAQELLAAIDLAVNKEQSCEVVVDLRQARKLLKNLGYLFRDYKKGILMDFPQKRAPGQKPKSQIYVHS